MPKEKGEEKKEKNHLVDELLEQQKTIISWETRKELKVISTSNHWFLVSCMDSIVEDVLSMAKDIKANF